MLAPLSGYNYKEGNMDPILVNRPIMSAAGREVRWMAGPKNPAVSEAKRVAAHSKRVAKAKAKKKARY
jgi:hypothetical protein